MIPRLQAEEAFQVAERAAVGAGSTDTRAILQRWSRAAEADVAPVKALPHALGLFGIGLRRVPRQAAAVQTSALDGPAIP